MRDQSRQGAIYNYLNLLLINVVGIIITPFVIRHLGPSQYGLYSLAGAILPYFALLDLGLGKTITRYVAIYRSRHDEEGEARFLTTTARLFVIIVVIMLAIGACIYVNIERIWGDNLTSAELSDLRRILLLVIATHTIILPGNGFTAICYGTGHFAFPRGIQTIKLVVRTICIIGILLWGKKALALIALDLLLNVIVALATLVYVHKHIGRRRIFSRHTTDYMPIIHYSLWIFVYAATGTLQWYAGQFVVGMTSNTTAIGTVGIGILLGTIYGYFAETINKMQMPQAAEFIKCNPTGRQTTDEMIRIGRIVAIPQLFILGGFAIFGKSFVTLWAGEIYQEAYLIALIMMASWTVKLTQDYGNSLLEAKGLVKTMSIINFITIFAAVIVSYFSTLRWGSIGMIITLSGGTILATIANNIYFYQQLRLDIARYLKKVFTKILLIISILTLLFNLIFDHQSALTAGEMILGAIAYTVIFVLSVYFYVLTRNERTQIKLNERKRH